jgi:ABC-type nickel/cobalt efflux system permease component RcnA
VLWETATVWKAEQVANLEGPPSIRHLLATTVSIGIRPCSGAILVLILAFTMDLPLAGARPRRGHVDRHRD